jgi:long-chain acyl-CoA synthetase
MVFITIEQEAVKKWAKQNDVDFVPAICNNLALKKIIMADILKIAKENKFNSLEKPKQMHLIFELWTVEMDMLTPTQKLKRNIARSIYEQDITRMYDEGKLKL